MRTTDCLIKCYTEMLKDFRILKFLFIIIASYLIFEELYNFAVVKPSYTSTLKRKLSTEDFPEMIVCPEPSIDVNEVASKGYQGVKEYFMGFEDFGMPLMGWSGNKSANASKVIEDISTLKTAEDCYPRTPSLSNIWSIDNMDFELIQFSLTKALYTAPLSGRCSKLPRAGVILPQIIPKGMWGPENVKFKII